MQAACWILSYTTHTRIPPPDLVHRMDAHPKVSHDAEHLDPEEEAHREELVDRFLYCLDEIGRAHV